MNASATATTAADPLADAVRLVYDSASTLLDTVQGSVDASALVDFVDTIRWREPFILSLLALQLTLFAVAHATRRRPTVQFFILAALTATAIAAQSLNTLAKRHWRSFASQDYFDSAGLFVVIFVTGPFVILANLIVIRLGLTLVKTFATKQRYQQRLAQSSTTTSTATATGGTAAWKKDS